MTAIIYRRVSSDEQAESGLGLEAQLESCRRHCSAGKHDVGGVFSDEGIGGAAPLDKRPALMDAITRLRPGDLLLVAKRDRLGRDPIAVAMIEAAVRRKRARIVSAAGRGTESDGPTDVLMRRIVDAFAEYERLLIKARTAAATQAKIRRGERAGKLRLGYQLAADGKTLIIDAGEQEIVRIIGDLRESGESLRAIAAELTRRGLPTKEGNSTWKHTTIARVLKRIA